MERHRILDKADIARKVTRIAYQVLEENYEESEIYILGILEEGMVLAGRICEIIRSISPETHLSLGSISIHKSDPHSVPVRYSIDPDLLQGKTVVLVDDVGNTGSTLFYAMQPLMAMRPKKIQAAVLVDRRHKLFPVNADIVGMSLATTMQEHITVVLNEEEEAVYLS